MLLRRYIGQRLIDYYAQPYKSVVGSRVVGQQKHHKIDYRFLLGEAHWKRLHKKIYRSMGRVTSKRTSGQWLTPTELFAPHYSYCIAEYIAKTVREYDGNAFQLLELGGGHGTNAQAILQHLQDNHESIYQQLESFTVLDGSPTLSQYQQEQFKDHEKVRVRHLDLIKVAENRYVRMQQPSLMKTISSFLLCVGFFEARFSPKSAAFR